MTVTCQGSTCLVFEVGDSAPDSNAATAGSDDVEHAMPEPVESSVIAAAEAQVAENTFE